MPVASIAGTCFIRRIRTFGGLPSSDTVSFKDAPVTVAIKGKGKFLSSISFDGRQLPSAIVPDDTRMLRRIDLRLGPPTTPYLAAANAVVISPLYHPDTKRLEFDLESFAGHLIDLEIVSPTPSQNVAIDGRKATSGLTELAVDGSYTIHLHHRASSKRSHYVVTVR